ncbi:MAG: hypothetical protein RSA66_10545 [Muribaculaceae bacterium]
MIIDGVDIPDMRILEGSYANIVNLPSLKSVPTVDWWEEDGIDVDLSDPKLNAREISINIGGFGLLHDVGALIERINDGAYHVYRILGQEHRWRLVKCGKMEAQRFSYFALTFSDDFPNPGMLPIPLIRGGHSYFGDLNGQDLREYGITILDGTLDRIKKLPDVKENLTVDNRTIDGVVYDGKVVKYKSKDIQLKCLMKTTTLRNFWGLRGDLLLTLSGKSERSLYVNATEETYPCYYKSCTTHEFATNCIGATDKGTVWWTFTLTLAVTRFRPVADEYLLAAEKGEWVVTEDNEYAIDLGEIKI